MPSCRIFIQNVLFLYRCTLPAPKVIFRHNIQGRRNRVGVRGSVEGRRGQPPHQLLAELKAITLSFKGLKLLFAGSPRFSDLPLALHNITMEVPQGVSQKENKKRQKSHQRGQQKGQKMQQNQSRKNKCRNNLFLYKFTCRHYSSI